MIKTVIKKDGRREPFEPEKLVGWAEWSCVVGANWGDILKSVYTKVKDECTTEELQSAMIKACLDKEDEPHSKMAGRLYMGGVYKECFGGVDFIPSLQTYYTDMVALGFMEDLGYSPEELGYFDRFLEHEEDLELSYPQAKQIVGKYSLKNRVTGQLFETPQFSVMRMALGSCKGKPRDERVIDVVKFFQHFKTSVNCTTPDWNNLGTFNFGYASCCLFTAADNTGSLNARDNIAYNMTVASAGLGSMLLTRSAGDPIRGGTVKHNGKIPYLRLAQEISRANKQGARSGAETQSICALDPEIMDLLMCRNPKTVASKKVDGIDYAFSSNESFIRRAANREDWMLISIYYAPDLWEAFFDEDCTRFDTLYDKYLLDDSVPKTIIKAMDVLLLHVQNQQEVGRQYRTNITEINRHTPLKAVIHHSNLCVAPETQILTSDGYFPIAELEGDRVEVWNGEEFSTVDIRKTGVGRPLSKVTTSSGQVLECTDMHKWYVSSGYGKPCVEKRTRDLLPGDKLIKFNLPVVEGASNLSYAYENGFFSGDGSHCNGIPIIYLYGEKKKLKEHINCTYSWYEQPDYDRIIGRTVLLKDKFFVPCSDYSIESRLDWLAGYLDADGCVYRNGNNEALVASSETHSFLLEVQMMLQTLGVSAKISKMSEEGLKLLPLNDGTGNSGEFLCQDSYRLLITSYDTFRLLDLGLDLKRLKVNKRRPQRDANNFNKVVSVIDEGRVDDTYCFTEPKRGMGMFNGILTGQCLEIMEHTRPYKDTTELYRMEEVTGEIALCNLSAIIPDQLNLKVVDGDFTKDSMERYEEACYYALKKIDNTLDIMDYPFPNLEYTATRRRYAGVGVSGLAYEMALKGFKYSSDEGKRYMHMLAELHMYSLIRASIRISKERGCCEWIDRTKWVDGWTPLDTYNKNIDRYVDGTLNRDWDGLKEDLIANGGHRFSLLCAHMPTESSSLAANRPNSLYPIRDLVLIKGDGDDAKVFIAPEAERLKDAYELAWDLSLRDQAIMYGIWQKFCDQGISADTFIHRTNNEKVTPRFSARDLVEYYLFSYHIGVKSGYYTNSKNSGDRSDGKEIIDDDSACVGVCEV